MAANSAVTAPAAPVGGVTFPWWVTLIAGIAMIFVGLLLLAAPAATTAVLVQLLGWYFSAFRGAGWGTGILGAISIFLGLVLMFNPLPGVIALPFVLGFAALVGGIIAPVVALGNRAGRPGA
jgi:uncharacterized membrane protein HdeD (DUF308 family)